ncbi:MAG TPA: TonB family protein [Candidatus Kryptobacter bacterium]|jgi:periplasmic protein TonB|nr:TonB family protein [Candidatus Kryptobacter bacterium]
MATKKVSENAQAGGTYGAPVLKRLAQKYTGVGLAIAIAVHFAGVGAYWGAQYLNREDDNAPMVRVLKYSELGPPPSITNQQALPQVAVSTPMAKPNVGIPVPVPDAEVSPEQTIATQQELSKIAGPMTQGSGGDSVGVSMGNFKVPDDGPPPDFVPVEKEPQIIKQVIPKYPELAQRAGIEGRVIVKIWVDKDGKPHKAIVMKSDAEIFNQPSIDAAMQYRFTPAIMNKGPVAVWVVIPFTFKLKQQ